MRKNGKNRKLLFSDNEMIKALENNRGLVTFAARELGCHYTTIEKRIRESKKVKDAYEQICEFNCDNAENTILKAFDDGDVDASFKYLAKKGKHRGWGNEKEAPQEEKELTIKLVYPDANTN